MVFRNAVFVVVLIILPYCVLSYSDSDTLTLSVIHFNDFHSRIEETFENGQPCNKTTECIGGFSRLYHEIMRLRKKTPDSILLDAGDTFFGTHWYSIEKWKFVEKCMKTLPIDASVLGNHEFDDGIDGLIPYIKALNHPVIVSNLNSDQEPSIKNMIFRSSIIYRKGKKIGIIGVITTDKFRFSNVGKLTLEEESASVNEEADRLVREEGVFTNIILSHAGYDVDQQIAANASKKISLIVGGHTHTFLFSGDNKPGPDTPEGLYPTIVKSIFGHSVLIVQASAFCKYLGSITIHLDKNGEIAGYSGKPIFLDTTVPQDSSINEMIAGWKKVITAKGNTILANTLVTLSKEGCFYKECTLGNFVTDAFVYYFTKNRSAESWTSAPIAIINAGGLRANIDVGDITHEELLEAQPFGNYVNLGDIQGKVLQEMFEATIYANFSGDGYSSLSLLQVSGIKVTYNMTKPSGQQIESILIRCQNCTIPIYEPLESERYYKIALPTFLSNGNDGFVMLRNVRILQVGPKDVEAFKYYFEQVKSVYEEEEGRIVIHGRLSIPNQ